MTEPLTAIRDACFAELALVAPCFEGRGYLTQNDSPPRFVWVLIGCSSKAPTRTGGTPRSLHDDGWNVSMHCWGRDDDDAMRLRRHFVSAVRRAVQGHNYELGATEKLEASDDLTAHGSVFLVALTVWTPLAEAPAPGKATRPAGATQFVLEPGVTGDGVLETGET